MKNPFDICVEISGQGKKLLDQMVGLDSEQAQELITEGWFTTLRKAMIDGTLPDIDQFRRFVSGRMRLVEVEKILECSRPFELSDFFDDEDAVWDYWCGRVDGSGVAGEPDIDERCRCLTSVNFAQLEYVNCLKNREKMITTGELKLERLKKLGHVRLGGIHFSAFSFAARSYK